MAYADSAVSHYCGCWPPYKKKKFDLAEGQRKNAQIGEKRRHPNRTVEQWLVLAGLTEENKGVWRGKFISGIMAFGVEGWTRVVSDVLQACQNCCSIASWEAVPLASHWSSFLVSLFLPWLHWAWSAVGIIVCCCCCMCIKGTFAQASWQKLMEGVTVSVS